MILDIKAYIKKHRLVTQQQLCSAFSLTAEALEPMLDHWLDKQAVKRHQPCGNCQLGCHSDHAFYCWNDGANPMSFKNCTATETS